MHDHWHRDEEDAKQCHLRVEARDVRHRDHSDGKTRQDHLGHQLQLQNSSIVTDLDTATKITESL